ncbi:MAG TPA: ATP-binding protein, partial [Acetobacteraceae bacterium]|nr:ATP-binding protein [Acetobacteraceae bacterium]
ADDVSLTREVAGRIWEAVERARSQDALRELNETLERRVEERTAELQHAEAALRQVQKMEAVGQLTGGIAHDFNNMLTGISGALELLETRLEAGRTDDMRRYISAAVTASQRAASLTQRLLAFARRQPLDPKRVQVERLVPEMDELLRRSLGPAIALEIVMAPALWPILCDPNQLESAILNLAINARDAMPQGGRLVIEAANAELDEAYSRMQGGEVKPGQYVAISVTDTGSGMSKDLMGKVFEPFFTTKPIGQGTGLGLSMLYGFIRQSEGHVHLYSEEGQGTTFKLYFPRYWSRIEEEGAEKPASAAGPALGEGRTVLVVEDEATVRMLITETLEDLGHRTIEAADGPSGLGMLQSGRRIDLLITDVGLPGLNGRQVADAGRLVRPGLKVLFITGYAHNAAVGQGEALEAGMEIMTKPFALNDLAARVRSMLEG